MFKITENRLRIIIRKEGFRLVVGTIKKRFLKCVSLLDVNVQNIFIEIRTI